MNIKIKRVIKGFSQEELSKIAGVSRNTIVKLEKGESDGVRFGIIKKIAKALDTTVQDLFFSEDE